MKKILLALSIIFTILTFAGAAFVLLNKGTVNAGYAVVPMLFEMICCRGYRKYKDK